MLDQLLAILLNGGEYIGPALVAVLVVPIFGELKKAVRWLGGLPSLVQRIAVLIVAALLTYLGAWLNVALPTDIHLFQSADVSAVLSALFSMLIHADIKRGRLHA